MPKPPKHKLSTAQARQLLKAGKPADAALLLKRLIQKQPGNCEALELMAELSFRQGDAASAIRLLKSVIARQPGNIAALNKLAVVLATGAQLPEAAACLRQAVALDADCFPAQLDLCKVTRDMGLLDESINAGMNAVRIQPNDARAHSSLALSFERFGQHLKAHEHYLRAAELAPDDMARCFAAGVSFIGMGNKQQAQDCLQQVIERQPQHAQAHWMLSRLDRCRSTDDPRLAQLQSMLDGTNLADEDRTYLNFALGNLYEDCQQYEQAFAHFTAGNRLENARYQYRPEDYRDAVDALIKAWPCERLAQLQQAGSDSRQPVFIVGLPRSGTTLVEQILAAHPQVFGAGELSWFGKTEQDLQAFIGSKQSWPACAEELEARHIPVLADKYLAYINTLAEQSDYRHITDKMPSNYERIGLIATLFPQARIVHCRRDPLDNAISQYCLLFQGNMEYSHDLYNLGTHHADYQRLMAHWSACLPGQILDLDYEQLVAEQDSTVRTLLEFIGLPWDDACLNFFESKRAVRTSSDFQVRSPIYSSSIGRWRHYDRFLEPLRRGLQGLAEN